MNYGRKREQLDKIYRVYADDIYRVCLHYTKDEQLAQDVMQETFLDYYNNFENLSWECAYAYLVYKAKELADERQKNSED